MLHTLHVRDVTRCNDVGSLVTKIHDNVTSQRDSTRNGAAMKHWKLFTSKHIGQWRWILKWNASSWKSVQAEKVSTGLREILHFPEKGPTST